MASFRKRSGRWQARITRKGHSDLTKTFTSKKDAQKWARSIEREIDTGIVKIIGLHPNQSELLVPPTDALWTAQAPQPMIYDVGDQKVRRSVGPIPDSYLQPIRGEPMGQDIALLVELQWLRDRVGELAVKQRVESYL